MNDFISKLRKPNLTKRAWKRIRSIFYTEQWVLLFGKDFQYTNPTWDGFIQKNPPPGLIWADPFVWMRDGNFYIFFEEKPLGKPRGWINCMTVDNDLNVLDINLVLEKPYHLSYPFLFDYKGVLYMLPESGENETIEVYECLEFPDQWKKVKDLMSGIQAVDSTLLEVNGKWWLFTNIAAQGGSNRDSLHLFYADSPLSEHWTPHPGNPVVQDIRSARPAGKIFSAPDGLIRPSQDSSVRYGYAVNFNRIERLSETEYKERLITKFKPISKNVIGTHTWNKAGDLCVIDAKVRRYASSTRSPKVKAS